MLLEEYIAIERRKARETGWKEDFNESYQEGFKEGYLEETTICLRDCLSDVLHTKGDVPTDLQDKIKSQTDIDILRTWFKKSLMVSTIEDFAREILSKESV